MRSVRWRKVLRDLGAYRTRTILVVMSIAVGVFAVGTIAGSDAMLHAAIRQQYAASRPSSAQVFTDPVDRSLIDALQGMPGVSDIVGRRDVTLRLQTGPQAYRELELVGMDDFEQQRMDIVTPQTGDWPPKRGEILIERSARQLVDLDIGDTVTVQTPNGKSHQLRVGGFDHDVGAPPAFYVGRVFGHVTMETLVDLGYENEFDELHVRVADQTLDRDGIRAVAEDVRSRVERAGVKTFSTFVPVPGKHPADDLLQGFFVVLGFIGALSLIVSGFLVVNTVSAILAQQTRQIGVMKAIGARSGQIAGLYLGLVLAYAVLALGVALPLGALGAYGFAQFTAGLANFDLQGLDIPPNVIALEVAVGLVVPLLAALVPVFRGVRITVREAIASTGIGDRFGRGRLDRALREIRGLSRPTLLSIRNTFRRKGRLILTLLALTLGGAVFMSVFSVRASLVRTLDDVLAYFAYDVQVELTQPAPAEVLTHEALGVPGVVAAEPWRFATLQRIRPNGAEGRTNVAFGLPPGAQTVRPTVQEGRWLLPNDGNAVVATVNIRDDEPDVRVGDVLTLRIDGQDTKWTLVGVVQSPTQRPFFYMPSRALEIATNEVGRAGVLMVVGSSGTSAASQDALARDVRSRLESAGIRVAATTTSAEIRATQETLFNILTLFLSTMAVLLGVVGALGLTGTMSINVVERAREIGVLRAVGASDGGVLRIFLIEGVIIGLLSWALGAIVAVPISKLLSDALGNVFARRPLAFAFSIEGVAAWLVIVLVLAAVASLLPAWRASRLAVREVLAYE